MTVRKKVQRPWVSRPAPNRDKGTDPFYFTRMWRAIRRATLRDEPACRVCRIYDKVPKVATVLDHFRPRRLWPELELAGSNLMPICDHHHAIKSGLETRASTREEWEEKVLPKYKECER